MARIALSLVFLLLLLASSLPHSLQDSNSSSSVIQKPSFPLASALFVIGDSTVDCGTNNKMGTWAHADHPPYGRDFDTHVPTGRFSNGRVIVDYLADRLGLPLIKPFLGLNGSIPAMIHGINYASGAAGIITSSGSDMGDHFSLVEQIQQVGDTIQLFDLNLGEIATADLISRSFFYVSIGTNDYIHYYVPNKKNVKSLYRPSEFNQLLANSVKKEIQNLYDYNVRKVVVMGLAPVGCAPFYLAAHFPQDSCLGDINDVMKDFNRAMRRAVEELNRSLTGATIIFCDAFSGAMDIMNNHQSYGFVNTKYACCGAGIFNGSAPCLDPKFCCPDASKYVWWDQFHPTDAVNRILADNVWSGAHTTMCYPVNMRDMIKLNQ